jgi:hypothetical protein
MKYWLFFTAKLALIAAVLRGIWWLMEATLPAPPAIGPYQLGRFGQDLPWTTAIFVFCLLGVGLTFLAVLDQRYRCRTCLRRLRMPVATGSWDAMLQFGRPKMEYICPFGHGTLDVHELQFAGRKGDDWRKNDDDIWRELESLSRSGK